MTEIPEAQLRSEILNLFQYIQRLREEITAISKHEGGNPKTFSGMTVQLDAIVEATENATNTILQATESVETSVDKLREAESADARNELCDSITEQTTQMLEACSFQDITGQRISKVMGSLDFVAKHVDAMVELWGRDEIEDLADKLAGDAAAAKDPDEVLLDGPQLPGEAISQSDIDALFD
ncbi:MAG: hypothetical protein QNJ94_07175 [Alphaproteobacteria bacterium]|nr:hypothetical protein [Alphaproteobacteria bacterium]